MSKSNEQLNYKEDIKMAFLVCIFMLLEVAGQTAGSGIARETDMLSLDLHSQLEPKNCVRTVPPYTPPRSLD